MPKVTGIFDNFENLDEISAEALGVDENYLANRILYPQVVPTTSRDLNFDLAILKEALKRNPVYFKPEQKKIFIPEAFISFAPDIKRLALLFIDVYSPKGMITFVITKSGRDVTIGTLITVYCKGQKEPLHFEVEGQNFSVKPGTLTVLPCTKEHCHVSFKAAEAKLLGKNEILFEVPGGELGLVVDGRWK